MNRKIIFGGLGTLVVVIVAVVVVLVSSLDRIVKAAVETFGSEMTKADVKLAEVNISASSGAGTLKGFSVGNPAGFTTPRAFYLGEVTVEIDPASIATDTVVINRILIRAPQVTYELASNGGNNPSTLQKNIEAYTGGPSKAQPAKSEPAKSEPAREGGKKMLIKDLTISEGKVGIAASFLGGKQLDANLPTIHLTDIGKESKGATAGEVVEKVMAAITKATASTVNTLNLDKLKEMGGAIGSAVSGTVDSIDTKAVGDELKGLQDKAKSLIPGFGGK